MKPTRRAFLRTIGGGLAAMGPAVRSRAESRASDHPPIDARKYLADHIYMRQDVDDWFAGKTRQFGRYDSELGWLLRDSRYADGIIGSTSVYSYKGKYDERRTIAYADQPCRINTYGDSFTQCHQVSDGETWQEVLASHLQEPIHNFGVGGYSVYQAYLRMLREEPRVPARYIILNIFDDDHYRNLDAWRGLRTGKSKLFIDPTLPYLKVNLSTGECEKRPNPCPTRESFYNLCDLDWVERRFRDDFTLGIMLAHANARQGNPERAYQALMDLAKTHGINTAIDRGDTLSTTAQELHTRASLLATQRIVEWMEEFAKAHGKKVLYVLSFRSQTIARRVKEGQRFDQPFVDFLKAKKLPYIDLMEAHLVDFADFKIDIEAYLKRYYIGHYNPLGNFFTAFAIKNQLVEMLDPKPSAYQPP